ncbi:hypothetical protein Hanom_Chr04g00370861 [Helianthus anomalus]
MLHVELVNLNFDSGVFPFPSCCVFMHAKACEDNQHAFVPLAFDTFGSLAPEAVRFLSRVQCVVHSNFRPLRGGALFLLDWGFLFRKGWRRSLLLVYLLSCNLPDDWNEIKMLF